MYCNQDSYHHGRRVDHGNNEFHAVNLFEFYRLGHCHTNGRNKSIHVFMEHISCAIRAERHGSGGRNIFCFDH